MKAGLETAFQHVAFLLGNHRTPIGNISLAYRQNLLSEYIQKFRNWATKSELSVVLESTFFYMPVYKYIQCWILFSYQTSLYCPKSSVAPQPL